AHTLADTPLCPGASCPAGGPPDLPPEPLQPAGRRRLQPARRVATVGALREPDQARRGTGCGRFAGGGPVRRLGQQPAAPGDRCAGNESRRPPPIGQLGTRSLRTTEPAGAPAERRPAPVPAAG